VPLIITSFATLNSSIMHNIVPRTQKYIDCIILVSFICLSYTVHGMVHLCLCFVFGMEYFRETEDSKKEEVMMKGRHVLEL